jgi:hypothetical protein
VKVQNFEAIITKGQIKPSSEHLEYKWVKMSDLSNYHFKDKSFKL